MARRKRTVKVKNTIPKEEIKETTVVNDPIEDKSPLELQTDYHASEAAKATREVLIETEVTPTVKAKELSQTNKWNAVTSLLMQKFPEFEPGELDLIDCTVEDRKVHIRGKLGMTDEEIAEVILGY